MSKPPTTSTNHILPYGELSPAQFERLCLWLVEREGYTRFEHLGEAGNEQGRDVIAYDSDDQLWYFQCKRYQTVSAQTLLDEVEKYNQAIADGVIEKPHGVVFVTNAVLSAQSRKKVAAFCAKHGFATEFWARTELDLRVKKHEAIVKEFFNLPSPISNPQFAISISRLPNMLTPDLFGRETEVQMLNDAWASPHTNVIVFTAFGGSGKSALVNHWMQEMAKETWRGAARVYAWSFWSQGTDQPQTSADPFIDAALRWFGDADPTAGSPWDKGERLARLIKQTRTLLILDGLEPLQHPKHTMEGRLKEQSMQALLKELAAGQPGLCVVSTREHVADLRGSRAPAVIAHDLEQLSPEAGASILRQQQIKGSDAELQQASSEFGNHALALTILASFLHNAYDGDIRKRNEIGPLTADELNGGHARRVMTSYETWLRDAGEDTLLAVLRVLGLFNRPADAAAVAALRAAPAIPDLTEALLPLSEPQWKQMLAKLRRLKLLTDSSTNDEVDTHAILREHFCQQLQRAYPATWQAGNLRLYEHLTRTAKEFPDTLEEMQPLFAAVTHGCAAGRQQQAYDEVYLRRILRGNELFNTKKIGALSAELAALSGFFATRWYVPATALTEADRSFVLNAAGFCLRALGRMREAVQPMQVALDARIAQENWEKAAISAGNLSELRLTLGDLPKALAAARQCVEMADRSGDSFMRTSKRTTLADALHQAGRLLEAAAEFRAAETLLPEWQPQFQILYALQGFRYCDLLLSQGQYQEVITRAAQTIETAKHNRWLLDIALDQLALGRAHLGLARAVVEGAGASRSDADAQGSLPEANPGVTTARNTSAPSVPAMSTQHLTQAADWLQRAVDGLRQAGRQDYLPRALLARAAWARVAGEADRAQRDLAEVFAIAERGEMRLHLCDAHLEAARLHLAQGHRDEAHSHWATAREMVAEMGYHRRDGEVAALAAQLGESENVSENSMPVTRECG